MAQARVWDLEGWQSPLKVSELLTKPGIGYFAVPYKTGDVAYDAAGNLFVRADTVLSPNTHSFATSWAVQASSSPEGVVLHLPKGVHNNIGEKLPGKKYLPVAKVVGSRVSSLGEPQDAAPPNPGGFTKTAGWQVVPLKALGVQIGTAKVTWGDGVVEVTLLDQHGSLKTYASVNGFKLFISPAGTTVSLER